MARIQIAAVFLLISVVKTEQVDVTVKSDAGTFIGFKEQVELDGKNVTMSKFLGIPFAEPPVGDLRFRKPVPKAPLRVPLKVQKFGSACLQLYLMFPVGERDSEDCLFLNIFKPEVEDHQSEFPVMVWLYGGGFSVGSSDPYIGDALAATGPVIVVTLNYRVSLWGFLSTGDSNADGNYGLWDQHMAIKWVHLNIRAFGGDPSRVTIFGQSAGAGSVVFQGLFPGNKGLFQRMIPQSGTATALWAITPKAKNDATHLASLVDCDTFNTKAMVDCLRSLPTEKLNATVNDVSNWEFAHPMPFVPVVDGEFVQALPKDVLDKAGNTRPDLRELFASFDLMTGITSGEGGAAVDPYLGADTTPENFLPNKTLFEETLVPIVSKTLNGNVPVVNQAIIAEYTDWNAPDGPENIRQMFIKMHGDYLMTGSTYRTLNAHAALSGGRTYQYYFNIVPYQSIFKRPSWIYKALHGDDLNFIFGNKFEQDISGLIESRDFEIWEERASKNVMTLWTNFAATGNPNKPRDLGLAWLPYTPEKHRYLELKNEVTSSKMKERLQERQALFWDEFVPSLILAINSSISKTPAVSASKAITPALSAIHQCSVIILIFNFSSFFLTMMG